MIKKYEWKKKVTVDNHWGLHKTLTQAAKKIKTKEMVDIQIDWIQSFISLTTKVSDGFLELFYPNQKLFKTQIAGSLMIQLYERVENFLHEKILFFFERIFAREELYEASF